MSLKNVFYFLFILLIYIHFKIIKATFLIFPLFPSRCVSPLLSLTGAPRGSWSCYPCAKTSGMFTLQRGETPGKGWKMRNVMFMVGKWKKMEKVFVAFVHLEVLILYIFYMFWYVYFKYVLQCLAYVFISFATFFFLNHLFGQRFECIVRMVSQFLNALQRFANIMSCYIIYVFFWKLFSPVFPLGSSTGYMSSGLTVADHLR